ncbi:MAG: glycosyl transferase family 28 [Flavipsychrobacter sp.]|nr:glycosyl transferase family 28 [Flavipsychrobacter sp.]
MVTNNPKHILIAPLDWGLGHTTRCVPIIRHIQSLGHVPVVAGNASQLSFIKETFDNIDVIDLKGYNVQYSKWNKWGQIGLLSQLPGISATINEEHIWLQQLVQDRQIDGIISDNRYGLYHAAVPSVILTHQLQVLSGMGKFADRVIQRIHYKYLEQFSAVWVADTPNIPNLSGKLAHTDHTPKQTKYIGLLSRFEGIHANPADEEHLLILLSGPEPQRSETEQLLWQQALTYKSKVTFVAGSDAATPPDHIPEHISYHKRLANKELASILSTAGMVVCRSGYSTIMDLVAMRKKAILIPTPGQTEQEYLASYLYDSGIFYAAKQKGFDLYHSLTEAKKFPFASPVLDGYYDMYQEVVKEWLSGL